MIKVLFFAQVRELVGTDSLTLASDYPDVAALRAGGANAGRWPWTAKVYSPQLTRRSPHCIIP